MKRKKKEGRWTVSVEVDEMIVRYNWLGRTKPNGYVAHIREDGESKGFQFGETRDEAIAKAAKRKAEILASRDRRANAEVIEL